MEIQVNYKFSPSLLDAFTQFLDSDVLYEKFFGSSEEPSLTCEEYEQKQFQELIDKINRVPFESEAADRGSCLNEVVDCIVMRTKSTRDDIEVRTIRSGDDLLSTKVCPTPMELMGMHLTKEEWEKNMLAECWGFFNKVNLPSFVFSRKGKNEFLFDTAFCKQLAEYFKDSLCQIYVEAPIETDYGTVLLYGYPDYVRGDMVYDLKTTSKYEFGKYSKYWQQHVYPYALIESGKCTDITAFEFTAFAMKGGTLRSPLIYGDMYPEVYTYDHRRSTEMLRGICSQFAEFLNNNRGLIIDRKIFGGYKDGE